LGIACGQTVWVVATSVGVLSLLMAYEPIYVAVKYLGAAYLIYLGIQALRAAARQPHASINGLDAAAAPASIHPLSRFSQGLMSNLGNPKMAAFFASLLPQFVSPGEATLSSLLFLGSVFIATTFVWLTVYVLAVHRVRRLLQRPSIYRTMQGLTGTALIGLGMRVAAE
jgi:threonine/homoserine/homoserine lactone efflux protein